MNLGITPRVTTNFNQPQKAQKQEQSFGSILTLATDGITRIAHSRLPQEAKEGLAMANRTLLNDTRNNVVSTIGLDKRGNWRLNVDVFKTFGEKNTTSTTWDTNEETFIGLNSQDMSAKIITAVKSLISD